MKLKYILFPFVIVLGLIGAKLTQFPQISYTRVNIIHDYMIQQALDMCKDHQGLHYMVHQTQIKGRSSGHGHIDDYPCQERTMIRCQDGSLHKLDTGVGHCFISEGQLQDTLNNKDVSNEYR